MSYFSKKGRTSLILRPAFDVLLRLAKNLEERFHRDQVILVFRLREGAVVVVVLGVDPALADLMVDLFCTASLKVLLLRFG